jgi:hypothetical protein
MYLRIFLACLLVSNFFADVTQVTLRLGNDLMGTSKRVYAFTQDDVYTGVSKVTDDNSVASFDLETGIYKYRFSYNGKFFWTDGVSTGSNADLIVPTPTTVGLSVAGAIASNQTVYLFDTEGTYLKYTRKTNESGFASFNVPDGQYKFRYSFNGRYWWSDIVSMGGNTSIAVPSNTMVCLKLADVAMSAGNTVYVFDDQGVYQNHARKTDDSGIATFTLDSGSYQFRYSYNGKYFWSPVVAANQTTEINVPAATSINLKVAGVPMVLQTIYAFDSNDIYQSYTRKTDADGNASFNLDSGSYKFRYLFNGRYWWSGVVHTGDNTSISVPVDTYINLKLGTQLMGEGQTIYVFDANDVYQKYTRKTDTSGKAAFTLPAGDYKFRYAYNGKYYWTGVIAAGGTADLSVPVATEVSLLIAGNSSEGKTIYAYDENDNYLKYTRKTDALGKVSFNLPSGNYKFRYAHNGRYFFSDVIASGASTNINVPADTTVNIKLDKTPIDASTIYAFDTNNVYQKYARKSDVNGQAFFTLEAGTYKFRYSYNGKYFWSEPVTAGGATEIVVPSTTLVNLTVAGAAKENQTIYLFDENDVYLKYTRKTDASGQASFNLADGSYKFRYSFNGKYWWSPVIASGATANIVVPGETKVIVKLGSEIVPGATVYLFDENDVYQKYTRKTDEAGEASFTLDTGNYKFRYSYNGKYYWSEVVASGNNTEIVVPVKASVDLTIAGEAAANKTIYVYDENNVYQNFTRTTDENGHADFNLESGNYKFRFSYNGRYFWSELVASGANGSIAVPADTKVSLALGQNSMGVNHIIYAYDVNGVYQNYTRKTDESGLAVFTLDEGQYKFRYSYNGKYFWSGETASTTTAAIVVPEPTHVSLTVAGVPVSNQTVYAFDENSVYQNYTRKTDENGQAVFSLESGTYKFRYSFNGKYFWTDAVTSGNSGSIEVPQNTSVVIMDGTSPLGASQTIYVFDENEQYQNYTRKTDENGVAQFTLETGDYKFRYSYDGKYYWSEVVAAGQNAVIQLQESILNSVQVYSGGQPVNAIQANLCDLNYICNEQSLSVDSNGVISFTTETEYILRLVYLGDVRYTNSSFPLSSLVIHDWNELNHLFNANIYFDGADYTGTTKVIGQCTSSSYEFKRLIKSSHFDQLIPIDCGSYHSSFLTTVNQVFYLQNFDGLSGSQSVTIQYQTTQPAKNMVLFAVDGQPQMSVTTAGIFSDEGNHMFDLLVYDGITQAPNSTEPVHICFNAFGQRFCSEAFTESIIPIILDVASAKTMVRVTGDLERMVSPVVMTVPSHCQWNYSIQQLTQNQTVERYLLNGYDYISGIKTFGGDLVSSNLMPGSQYLFAIEESATVRIVGGEYYGGAAISVTLCDLQSQCLQPKALNEAFAADFGVLSGHYVSVVNIDGNNLVSVPVEFPALETVTLAAPIEVFAKGPKNSLLVQAVQYEALGAPQVVNMVQLDNDNVASLPALEQVTYTVGLDTYFGRQIKSNVHSGDTLNFEFGTRTTITVSDPHMRMTSSVTLSLVTTDYQQELVRTTVTTDTFHFEDIPEDEYVVLVSDELGTLIDGPFEVPNDSISVEIGTGISLKVEDFTGAGVEGLEITLETVPGRLDFRSKQTDQQGYVHFRTMQNKNYIAKIQTGQNIQEILINDGEQRTISLDAIARITVDVGYTGEIFTMGVYPVESTTPVFVTSQVLCEQNIPNLVGEYYLLFETDKQPLVSRTIEFPRQDLHLSILEQSLSVSDPKGLISSSEIDLGSGFSYSAIQTDLSSSIRFPVLQDNLYRLKFPMGLFGDFLYEFTSDMGPIHLDWYQSRVVMVSGCETDSELFVLDSTSTDVFKLQGFNGNQGYLLTTDNSSRFEIWCNETSYTSKTYHQLETWVHIDIGGSVVAEFDSDITTDGSVSVALFLVDNNDRHFLCEQNYLGEPLSFGIIRDHRYILQMNYEEITSSSEELENEDTHLFVKPVESSIFVQRPQNWPTETLNIVLLNKDFEPIDVSIEVIESGLQTLPRIVGNYYVSWLFNGLHAVYSQMLTFPLSETVEIELAEPQSIAVNHINIENEAIELTVVKPNLELIQSVVFENSILIPAIKNETKELYLKTAYGDYSYDSFSSEQDIELSLKKFQFNLNPASVLPSVQNYHKICWSPITLKVGDICSELLPVAGEFTTVLPLGQYNSVYHLSLQSGEIGLSEYSLDTPYRQVLEVPPIKVLGITNSTSAVVGATVSVNVKNIDYVIETDNRGRAYFLADLNESQSGTILFQNQLNGFTFPADSVFYNLELQRASDSSSVNHDAASIVTPQQQGINTGQNEIYIQNQRFSVRPSAVVYGDMMQSMQLPVYCTDAGSYSFEAYAKILDSEPILVFSFSQQLTAGMNTVIWDGTVDDTSPPSLLRPGEYHFIIRKDGDTKLYLIDKNIDSKLEIPFLNFSVVY